MEAKELSFDNDTTEEEIVQDTLEEYNKIMNNLYRKYGNIITTTKIRLIYLKAITNHIMDKTVEDIDKDKITRIERKLDKIISSLK